MQLLTGRAQVERVYYADTFLAGFAGRKMFDGLNAEDARKLIFITNKSFFNSKRWYNIVRNEALREHVSAIHTQDFEEECEQND